MSEFRPLLEILCRNAFNMTCCLEEVAKFIADYFQKAENHRMAIFRLVNYFNHLRLAEMGCDVLLIPNLDRPSLTILNYDRETDTVHKAKILVDGTVTIAKYAG